MLDKAFDYLNFIVSFLIDYLYLLAIPLVLDLKISVPALDPAPGTSRVVVVLFLACPYLEARLLGLSLPVSLPSSLITEVLVFAKFCLIVTDALAFEFLVGGDDDSI